LSHIYSTIQPCAQKRAIIIIIIIAIGHCPYVRTYIHIYIPLIHKFVTKAVACETAHKYTNIQNFYNVKYSQPFTKEYYRSSLHVKISCPA